MDKQAAIHADFTIVTQHDVIAVHSGIKIACVIAMHRVTAVARNDQISPAIASNQVIIALTIILFNAFLSLTGQHIEIGQITIRIPDQLTVIPEDQIIAVMYAAKSGHVIAADHILSQTADQDIATRGARKRIIGGEAVCCICGADLCELASRQKDFAIITQNDVRCVQLCVFVRVAVTRQLISTVATEDKIGPCIARNDICAPKTVLRARNQIKRGEVRRCLRSPKHQAIIAEDDVITVDQAITCTDVCAARIAIDRVGANAANHPVRTSAATHKVVATCGRAHVRASDFRQA